MKLLDLFAGIGGFSLAAHWMGWQTAAFVEKDAFCQKVLAKNFAGVPIYGDITTFSGKPFRGIADIVTGGFPCQPFSQAGERKGKSDDRYLWDEMLRVIEEAKPDWVVGENVAGILSMAQSEHFSVLENELFGSTKENYILPEILGSLVGIGYEVQTFIIPACAVNAPHRRNRVWIIANAAKQGLQITQKSEQLATFSEAKRNDLQILNYAEREGLEGHTQSVNREKRRAHQNRSMPAAGWGRNWVEAATELCGVGNGVSNRVDRLKSLGNSIVPQIAFEIFKAIEAAEK